MSKVSPFSIVTSDMTLEEILQYGPTVQRALRRLGFPDCTVVQYVSMKHWRKAVLNYGLDLEKVLMTLNATIVKERTLVSKEKTRGRGTA